MPAARTAPALTVETTTDAIVTSGTVVVRGKKTASARLVETIRNGVVTGWSVEALCDGVWVTGRDNAWWSNPAASSVRFADLIHALTMLARNPGTVVA